MPIELGPATNDVAKVVVASRHLMEKNSETEDSHLSLRYLPKMWTSQSLSIAGGFNNGVDHLGGGIILARAADEEVSIQQDDGRQSNGKNRS